MPKAKLSKAVIDALPPSEGGQVLYHDAELPGFYLIVGKRSKTFAAQKDIRGRSVRHTIGKYGHFTPEDARKIAQEKLYLMSIRVNRCDNRLKTAVCKLKRVFIWGNGAVERI